MKKLLLGLLLFACALSVQAQTAEEIVEKHLIAVGAEKQSAIQSVKMEATVSVAQAAGMTIPLSIVIVKDKAARMDVSVMGMTQTTVINGDGGWTINPFAGQMEPQPLTADEVKQVKQMTDLAGPYFNYKEKGYTIEYLGTEDIDGVEAHKIKLKKSDTETQYSFFDPVTFYEIKTINVGVVDGKEFESSSLNSNFKDFDGMIFTMSVEQENPMAGTSVTKFTDIKINPEVDMSIFDMPKK